MASVISDLLVGIHLSPRTDLVRAALGGALLAASSTGWLYASGAMSGQSGILAPLVTGGPAALRSWRLSYVVGLLSAGGALAALAPSVFGDAAARASAARVLKPWAVPLAGALVGFGARLGGGCTSGHGICGLPRLSLRSFVAVGTFMATAAAAAADVGDADGLSELLTMPAGGSGGGGGGGGGAAWPALAATALVVGAWAHARVTAPPPGAPDDASPAAHAAALAAGATFGLGLGLAGMLDASKVSAFLNPYAPGGWDPSLAGVMGAGVAINALTFRALAAGGAAPPALAPAGARPLAASIALGSCEANDRVDGSLVLGAALFGIGWGISGKCPGPVVTSLAAGDPGNAMLLAGMLAGFVAYEVARARGALGAGARPSAT